MKKISLLLALILILFTFTACSSVEQTEPEEGLERVKLLTEHYINGEPDKTFEYDEKGNIVSRRWYMGGILQEEYKYLYDEQNRITDIFRGGDHTVKLYDKNGSLLSETTTDDKGVIKSEDVYKYDINNNLIERHYVSEEEEYKYTYKYNKQNKLIKETYKAADEKDDNYTVIYNYDSEGLLLSEEKAYSNGNTEIKYYNRDGSVKNWEERFAESGEIARGLCTYNQEGKLTEKVYYKDGSEEYQINRVYDEKGRLIKETEKRDFEENLDSVTTARFFRNKKGDISFVVEREHKYHGLLLTFALYGDNVEKYYMLDCGDIFDLHFRRDKYKTVTVDVTPERAGELKEIQSTILS